MTTPINFGGQPRAGAWLGRSEFADRLGPQYRVVVVGHRLLRAADLPQLGRDQLQRITVTTALRDDERDEAGAPAYRIEIFDQRLPFTRELLASFRLPSGDFARARQVVEALAAAIAANALDPSTADFEALARALP